MTSTKPTANKMGTMPVNKLLISMGLPMMISMLVQALYNIVDSVYVSRLSEDAFTAVTLAFPMQNLMIAVSVGVGVGMNSLLSRSLGEKDQKTVNKAANHGLVIEIIGYLLFLIIGIFISGIFMKSQTDISHIVDMGDDYLKICCIGSLGLFGQVYFERLLQSTGKTLFSMASQIAGAVINIILDPILIFGYLGFPKMGVAGAAAATIVGQFIAAGIAAVLNVKKNHEIKINLKAFKFDGSVVYQILMVGIPSIVMAAIGSLMTFAMNKILMAFTSTATAVFGAYFKLQSFIFMPVFGLNNAMVPIVAYNYGAKNKERMMKTIKLSIMYSVGIMLIGFIIMQIFPAVLLGMFEASETMLKIGVPALKIISVSFISAGYCIIISSVFQALGNGIYSMLVSIARQLVVLVPVAYLFSLTGKLNLVWWSFPIAELMSVAVCTVLFVLIYNKKIKNMNNV